MVYVDEVGQDLKGQNRKSLPFIPKHLWNQDTSSVGSEVKGTSRVVRSNCTLKSDNSGNDSRPLQNEGSVLRETKGLKCPSVQPWIKSKLKWIGKIVKEAKGTTSSPGM